MEYEISDQPQEGYRPERVSLEPEPQRQEGELSSVKEQADKTQLA